MQQASVLIIDDDEIDRYLLRRLLQQTPYEFDIIERDDGSSALEFLLDQSTYVGPFPPLILFLDINMPLMRGPEFLREFDQVRSRIYPDSCVIMMFSSSEHPEDREHMMRYEFVKDYLVKGSFTSEELGRRIEAALEPAAALP